MIEGEQYLSGRPMSSQDERKQAEAKSRKNAIRS